MNPFIRKHALIVTTVALGLFLYSSVMAGPVSSQQAQKVAETFLKTKVPAAKTAQNPNGFGLLSLKSQSVPASLREIRDENGAVLAYISEFQPCGFIAIAPDTDIAPIVAYSFRTSFPADNDTKNPLYRMLKADMKLRARALVEYEQSNTSENRRLWNLYADEDGPEDTGQTFQQWPEEKTTFTGGWLETMWHQGPFYNAFCPLDPVDANRAYVGCVATAMAQLVNYHKKCEMQFDEDDSYTTYAGINFDSDSELYDFPSFEELNEHITDIQAKYDANVNINDMDAAVLSFACGIAVRMDYSSEGSGASPYDLHEALLDKLGYYSADMTGGLTHESYHILQENMINGLPAFLSITSPDGWSGHEIVCDGYNTNGEYHLNFGWGAEYPEEMTEVWYHLPENLMSDLSIITEAILNVQSVEPEITVEPASLSFYAVPGQESDSETLYIENNVGGAWINSISSSEGFVFAKWGGVYSNYMEAFQFEGPGSRTSISVKFLPQEARGYYGTIEINYGDGHTKSIILKGYSFTGGTEIPAGQVHGTWRQDQSPYFVTGDISVRENDALVIKPGVQVFFMGHYGMTIGENARLTAEGTETSPIEFTAWNRDEGWAGLRFLDSGSDDVLSHCSISFSKKTSGFITDYNPDADENSCGGAVFCYYSDPTITNCKITNNIGNMGGAIYCDESYPIISNTVIANNASMGGDTQCGGICVGGWGEPEIMNCTIVNNLPGGIFTESWEGIDVTNTIVWGNDRYQIQTEESTAMLSFCDIQDGYDGEGNIDANPCFLDPSIGVGPQYDGLAADWMLQSCSSCINSGTEIDFSETDLAGNPRIYSDIIDIGAYENQSELPLITIDPSVTVDAGCVLVDTESSISFDIVNTGKMDFNIESLNISDVNNVFSIANPIENHLLEPGDSVTVEVGFNPVEQKKYTGTLEVHSNCSNAPIKSVSLRGVGVTGTIVSAGEVRGTWRKAESPYTIAGDIYIPTGRTLTIEPGVVVKFAGHFKFTVGYRATLNARGTEEENIIFTAIDTDEGWFGLRFISTGYDDTLEYCTIEYSKKPRSEGGGFENIMGGAILCCGSTDESSYYVPSSPTINHCLIANNHAEYGGGIMLMDDSEAVVTNNRIVDNSADMIGAGIFIYFFGGGTITNNIIAHNDSSIIGGGIANLFGSPSITSNTIVQNRPSGLYLDVTPLYPWEPGYGLDVSNNIIWQNEIYMEEGFDPEEYVIRYNDIQGEWEGDGNIDVDPLFADAENRDYHLKSQAGRWDPETESWVVDESTSPCIDAGVPQSTHFSDEPVPNGGRINMGAYGGTAQASKSI
jgi:hypothetical protein